MKRSEINLRDPYILLHQDVYYLYGTRGETAWVRGTGFDVYTADSLDGEWQGPTQVFYSPDYALDTKSNWAPEVHHYQDAFYMFATFTTPQNMLGTYILKADSPMGPFVPTSDKSITPADWMCLDGTLYVENNTPYLVFCHEWTQIQDGTMCYVALSDDLSHAISEPQTLFSASSPSWANKAQETFVTDGPFLHRLANGTLVMIWSSSVNDNYVQACSVSESGTIQGPWIHHDTLIFEKDGGHGMLFYDKADQLLLTLHAPNINPQERPCFFAIEETENGLRLK